MASPAKTATKIKNRLAGKEKIVTKAQRKKEWKKRTTRKWQKKGQRKVNSQMSLQEY